MAKRFPQPQAVPSPSPAKRLPTGVPSVNRGPQALTSARSAGTVTVRDLSSDRAIKDTGADTVANLLTPHPRYQDFREVWQWLGYAYEGDGPYLNGSALIAHPREAMYAEKDGRIDYTQAIGSTQKYQRRQRVARYDNLAEPLLDTVADYLFIDSPERSGEGPTWEAYEAWLQNVDGQGTQIDDWMKETCTEAMLYGSEQVSVERQATPTPAISLAEQGPVVLRTYAPLDTIDWVWSSGKGLTAVKLLESVPRKTVTQTFQLVAGAEAKLAQIGSTLLDDGTDVEVRIWEPDRLHAYFLDGSPTPNDGIVTNYGEVPVLTLYHRRRRKVKFLGASLLGDPRLYRDHFNLVSEMRDLLRSQTFSMLAVELGPDETVEEARSRLGDKASASTVIWHRGSADYVSPSDSPVLAYVAAIAELEKKIFRRVGLSWEGNDSYAPETEGSRRIKAMDLNRILAGQADECQQFEFALARKWAIVTYGRQLGLSNLASMNLRINYPDEFYVQQAAARMLDIQSALAIGFGPTMAKELRKSAVPLLLRNLDDSVRAQIDTEIEGVVDTAEKQKRLTDQATVDQAQANVSFTKARAAGKGLGTTPPNATGGGGGGAGA